jgi:hypothetical protein
MITQLNPPIPMRTPIGKGMAQLVIDMGIEHDLIWVVFQADGECWCWGNKDIRAEPNITIGRMPKAPEAKK